MSRIIPDYRTLKSLARHHKCSIKDLIALAPQNDPYYVGSPSEIRHSRWMASIVDQFLQERDIDKFHDRAIHYYILSRRDERPSSRIDTRAYVGDNNDFAFTMKSVQNARYLGYIPWSAVKDEKNPDPLIYARYRDHMDTSSFQLRPELLISRLIDTIQPLNLQLQQAYHVELWAEKTTINDILIPIARKYGVNVQTFSGQATATRVYELIERIRSISKPVRILYISDFDRYGHNMPVSCGRKIQWFVDHEGEGLDIKLDKTLLTEEQVRHYELPSAPGEENKVELDALEVFHPGETARIMEEAVARYINLDIISQVDQINRQIRGKLYQALLDVLEPIRNQIESIQLPECSLEDLPQGDLVDENPDILYDSSRDYFTQTDIFKRFLESREN